MNIVTRRLRTATWYAPTPSGPSSRKIVAPYSSWPMTWLPLPTSPYSPKNSPSRSGGDEPDHQHAIGDLDATEPAPEDRAGDQERHQAGRPEAKRDATDQQPDRP